MGFIKTKQKAILNNYKNRISIYILVPVLITLIIYSILNFYLLNRVNSHLLTQCILGHENFAYNYEQEFYTLNQTSIMLMYSENFKDIYFNQERISPENHYLLLNAKTHLITFAASRPYILQIGYINNVNNLYISSNGTSDLEYYYNNNYYGTIVNKGNYIENYKKRGSIFQIQNLDEIFKQTIIPLFQYQLGEYNLSSPLIYYISKPYFSSKLINYISTPNTNLFIYSNITEEVIASSNVALEDNICDIINKSNSIKDFSIVTINNKQYYLLTSYSESNYTDSLLFISLIPRDDIIAQTKNSWLLSLFTLLICSLFSSSLSFILASKLYVPIRNIINIFDTKDTNEQDNVFIPIAQEQEDEILYLDRNIKELLTTNKGLKTSITNALPALYSRYILNILHQEEFNNQSLEPILKDYGFKFQYKYFTCSIVYTKLTEDFYQHFTKAEQSLIKQQFADILSYTSENTNIKYVFNIAENTFCILSNSPNIDEKESLTHDFMKLQQLFSFDKDFIRIYFAAGKTYPSLQEIHLSWKEANKAFSQLSTFRDESIVFFEETIIQKHKYLMDPADDSRLTSLLLQGNKESAITMTREIILLNKEMHLSEESTKNLYIHLYEIGDKVYRRYEGDDEILPEDKFVNLSVFINNLTNLERSNYIQLFYEYICDKQSLAQGFAFNMEDIKKYVDEHFCEDIYLESLAETFHTSPKYMSRLLKQALGMPYKQYVTTLRIEMAKQLIAESDLKLDEIALSVGYNNRSSFIRTFKQAEGMTPSEYRGMVRN